MHERIQKSIAYSVACGAIAGGAILNLAIYVGVRRINHLLGADYQVTESNIDNSGYTANDSPSLTLIHCIALGATCAGAIAGAIYGFYQVDDDEENQPLNQEREEENEDEELNEYEKLLLSKGYDIITGSDIEIPDEFRCCVFKSLMRDPVIPLSKSPWAGESMDKKSYETLVKTGRPNPITGEPLIGYIQNNATRSSIEKWVMLKVKEKQTMIEKNTYERNSLAPVLFQHPRENASFPNEERPTFSTGL